MSRPKPPRKVAVGGPILAADFNAVRDLAMRSRIARVGPGLLLSESETGTLLSLSIPADSVRWGRIASNHPQVATAHATLTYSVKLFGDGLQIDNLVPLNRLVRPADIRKVIPARLKSLCAVVYPKGQTPSGKEPKELLVFDEIIAEKVCGSGGGGDAGAATVSPFVLALIERMNEMERRLDAQAAATGV